jgi:hypothetical protein
MVCRGRERGYFLDTMFAVAFGSMEESFGPCRGLRWRLGMVMIIVLTIAAWRIDFVYVG